MDPYVIMVTATEIYAAEWAHLERRRIPALSRRALKGQDVVADLRAAMSRRDELADLINANDGPLDSMDEGAAADAFDADLVAELQAAE